MMPITEPPSLASFFLIVADYDRRIFAVEGPITDDGPWNKAAGLALEFGHRWSRYGSGRVVQGAAVHS